MSKRLQILIPEEEMEVIRQRAKSEKLTVGEYVRRALREVESRKPPKSLAAKLALVYEASGYSFPTTNIEEMNREIELGYKR